MENRFWLDSYDFVRNERGFSSEELETVHRLLSEGKKVWMTPIRIEEDEQLETLRISESRCRMLRMGSVRKRVYFTPADEGTFRYMVSVMNKEQKEYLRSHRCLVPGERKDYMRWAPMGRRCLSPDGELRFLSVRMQVHTMSGIKRWVIKIISTRKQTVLRRPSRKSLLCPYIPIPKAAVPNGRRETKPDWTSRLRAPRIRGSSISSPGSRQTAALWQRRTIPPLPAV